jgi:hypothetical protein
MRLATSERVVSLKEDVRRIILDTYITDSYPSDTYYLSEPFHPLSLMNVVVLRGTEVELNATLYQGADDISLWSYFEHFAHY